MGVNHASVPAAHPMIPLFGAGPVGAVSCDDILPVLVLLLLQWSPWLLSLVHINCCILTDFIAPFLSSGWHGYSLAAFTSAVVIIKKL